MSSRNRALPRGDTLASTIGGIYKPRKKTIIVDDISTVRNIRSLSYGKKCSCGAGITRSKIMNSKGDWIFRNVCTASTYAAKNCPLAKRN